MSKRYLLKSPSGSGAVVVGKELGKGGEGSVYVIESCDVTGLGSASDLVAKIYHSPGEGDRKAKIHAMVSSKPDTDSLAWPLGVLYDNSVFVGYVMRKLDSSRYRDWSELSSAKERRASAPDFDFRYALHACRNLAAAVDSAHQVGAFLGDINESNDLVGADASVLVVDTDSAQIRDSSGRVFPCLVGKPEFTAPEISKGRFEDNPRTRETDVFAYTVMVFQMLTGGAHPTDGKFSGSGSAPGVRDRILQGAYSALRPTKGFEKVDRIPVDCIPSKVLSAVTAGLSSDPSSRPSLHQFVQVYDDVLSSLKQCNRIPQHWFDKRDYVDCPWCARRDAGLYEPWGPQQSRNSVGRRPVSGSSGLQQSTLPTVSFGSGNSAGPSVQRVKLSPNGASGGLGGFGGTLGQSGPVMPSAGLSAPSSGYPGGTGAMVAAMSSGTPSASSLQPGSSYSAPSSSSSNSGSGISQQSGPQSQPSSQQPSQSSVPKKVKGKTVLTYVDGTHAVRPSIGYLLRSDPSTAWFCIKNETPGFAQAWWSVDRPLVIPWASAAGLVLGLAVSAVWLVLMPMVAVWLGGMWPAAEAIIVTVLGLGGILAAITSAIACLCLLTSSLLDYRRAKKQNPDTSVFKRDKWWVTVLRYLPITVVYGPLLLFILIISALYGAVSVVVWLIENILSDGGRRRY